MQLIEAMFKATWLFAKVWVVVFFCSSLKQAASYNRANGKQYLLMVSKRTSMRQIG